MKKYFYFEFKFEWKLLWLDIKDFWKYKILRQPRPLGGWKWYGSYGHISDTEFIRGEEKNETN